MVDVRRIALRLLTVSLMLSPLISFADDDTDTNIVLGRTSVLIERTSDGLETLTKAKKANISSKWANEIQDKAAALCSFMQEKLKKEHLDDKDMPLCSVE